MRDLLDPNACSWLMRGDERTAESERGATETLMWTIVIGELLYWFGSWFRFNRNRADLV